MTFILELDVVGEGSVDETLRDFRILFADKPVEVYLKTEFGPGGGNPEIVVIGSRDVLELIARSWALGAGGDATDYFEYIRELA